MRELEGLLMFQTTLKSLKKSSFAISKEINNIAGEITHIEVKILIPYYDVNDYLNEINRHLKGIEAAISKIQK
jgi:hypothetical protein